MNENIIFFDISSILATFVNKKDTNDYDMFPNIGISLSFGIFPPPISPFFQSSDTATSAVNIFHAKLNFDIGADPKSNIEVPQQESKDKNYVAKCTTDIDT